MDDKEENSSWRQLLWPFSLLYGAITEVRNRAFDYRLLKSQRFEVPVIAVGNLSTGGTGKTPAVEFILRGLPEIEWGVVSRGYGRNTRGLLLPTANTPASAMGDEPYQVFHKFPKLAMALSEKRSLGIAALLEQQAAEAILLDDAYQHRYVEASFYLLLTTYKKPFFRDQLLPAGNLRESARGRQRAQAILVTKCPPDMTVGDRHSWRQRLRAKPGQEVYFSTLTYEPARNEKGKVLPNGSPVHLISGIANPQLFEEECEAHFVVKSKQRYADHHHFSDSDIRAMQARLKEGESILTTEKDWVRLKGRVEASLWQQVYFLPMEMKVLFEEGESFLRRLREHIRQF